MEQHFVARAAQGHEESFAELVRLYRDKVYATCLQATRSPIDAEDLAQEVFVKAFFALPTFRHQSSFSSWLFRITTRAVIDFRRKHAARGQPLELDAENHEGGLTVEDQVLARERHAAVHVLLDQLSEPYRSVAHMYYVEERSYREISRSTGTPVKTVESQLYRARVVLRQKGESLR